MKKLIVILVVLLVSTSLFATDIDVVGSIRAGYGTYNPESSENYKYSANRVIFYSEICDIFENYYNERKNLHSESKFVYLNVYALNLLAGKYGLGVDGFDKDSKKAFDYYKKASDLGFAYAQCNLSYFYLHGEVVEKDVEKALELLENAAEAGDTTAMYDLWYLYSGQNEDVEKDIEKSNYWANKYNNRYRIR